MDSKYITYIGVDDVDIDLFESQYVVPEGMCYDSYLVKGDRIAVMEGNPGRIREIIDNRIRGTGDRTSAYYISLREKIFEILKLGGERDPEYVI